MYAPIEGQPPVPSAPQRRSAWAAVVTSLPVRAFALSLLATVAVWGRFLQSNLTLSPDAQAPTIIPSCRAATPDLVCAAEYTIVNQLDPGAPAWQESAADYFFWRARVRGEPRPHWNPYVGSGYPIALDAINVPTSPARWFLSHFPGDDGRDVLAFARFLWWTFGIVWAVGLCGAGSAALAGVAAVASLAPYGASFVDIVFLDADLLIPWFLLVLVAFVAGRLSLRVAACLSVAVGVVVSAMGFLQSQVVFCVAVGLLALSAVPVTRGRSLLLAAGFALGELVLMPSWLPILRNLDQFVSSRDVVCIVEKHWGWDYFRDSLLHPPQPWAGTTATLVGAGLLPFVERRWRFALAALLAIGVWLVMGLPHSACSLPLVNGVRFMRHLVPHFEAVFIFAVGAAIARLSERSDRWWPWFLFAGAGVLAAVVAMGFLPESQGRALRCAAAGAALGALALFLRHRAGLWAVGRRAAFSVGLVLFAFPAYLYGSPMVALILAGRAGGQQIARLPPEIDASTPLGAVQRLSEREDRRHVSPHGFLYSNWSGALGILDVLSIGAFYPVGYHELNGTLFRQWERDPQHGLDPDRFQAPPSGTAMSLDFQRVMAVNRVSLLTFALGHAELAQSPSPYEASKCRLLARSLAQRAESYLCPEVGGVGYFPGVVRVVRSRAEALDELRVTSPAAILRLALLGPEIDGPGAGSASTAPEVGAGRVMSFSRQGDDLSYVLEVERAGYFVIADTYFRGWRATVNGAPMPISRANVAFKALWVPAGRVELRLHFSPTS